jgi:hypothetical protein
MLPLKLEDLSIPAIKSLIATGMRESRTLDFKRDAVGGKDDDKREFLADVSALANSAGGDLLFGIEETSGEATAVPGVVISDPDAEILRLEQIVRNGLEPRLPHIDFRWVAEGGVGCLLVRVARSYVGPHRISFRDNGKFFARNSAGKYPLDVAELRAAFLSSEGVIESVRRFRRERLAVIEADEGALPIADGPRIVLHIIPLSAFSTATQLPINHSRDLLRPMSASSGFNTQHALEGFATYSGSEGAPDGTSSYTLLFRSGIIEAICTVGAVNENGQIYIPVSSVEWTLIWAFDEYKNNLARLGVEPPVYVFVSILGTKDLSLVTQQRFSFRAPKQRKDVILLPEIIVNDMTVRAELVLRSTFDLFWNAYGYPKSFSFDGAGAYIGPRF